MTKLNLTATDSKQQTVLDHLAPMVSDTLAEKINNGVYIEKDGKRLLNKKDLATFMEYAMEQAKSTIAEKQRKGAQAVCVQGDDIMNWAIHYFEESSIEGTLYNEDGSEYNPEPKKKPASSSEKSTVPAYTPPSPKPKPQMSIFDDLLSTPKKETASEAEHTAESRVEPAMIVDEETGEVLSEPPQEDDDELAGLDLSAFDKDALAVLDELFGNEIELR